MTRSSDKRSLFRRSIRPALQTIVHSTIVRGVGEAGLRVFRTKWFARFARRERISDASLGEAVRRAERGLIDADLGGGVKGIEVEIEW